MQSGVKPSILVEPVTDDPVKGVGIQKPCTECCLAFPDLGEPNAHSGVHFYDESHWRTSRKAGLYMSFELGLYLIGRAVLARVNSSSLMLNQSLLL